MTEIILTVVAALVAIFAACWWAFFLLVSALNFFTASVLYKNRDTSLYQKIKKAQRVTGSIASFMFILMIASFLAIGYLYYMK